MSKDDLLFYGALVVGGYLVVRNFPSIFGGGLADLAGNFAQQSYDLGFRTGQGFDQALKPQAQIIAETQGIPNYVPLLDTSTAAQQLAAWETAYLQQTNPLYGVPILGDLANAYHSLLTGDVGAPLGAGWWPL